jgi:hypothetical protein
VNRYGTGVRPLWGASVRMQAWLLRVSLSHGLEAADCRGCGSGPWVKFFFQHLSLRAFVARRPRMLTSAGHQSPSGFSLGSGGLLLTGKDRYPFYTNSL